MGVPAGARADATAGLPVAGRVTRADLAAFLRLCSALGLDPSTEVRAELDRLVERLAEQAGVGALLHGDPCFGNVLAVAGRARFIDFEQAAVGNGLTELAYLWIGFPTCGLVEILTEDQLAAAERGPLLVTATSPARDHLRARRAAARFDGVAGGGVGVVNGQVGGVRRG